MAQTLKNISDSIFEILKKFRRSDDNSEDEDWMYYKINQIRAELIAKNYALTGSIDQSNLSDLGLVTCYEVNMADNITVNCNCPISKTTIPQVLTLTNKQGNQDLGLYAVMSACGTKNYYQSPLSRWRQTPDTHTNSLFTWYFRVGTQLYISKAVEKVRIIALLLDPTEGYLINSTPVASGVIALGVVYYVSTFGGGIVYNSTYYAPGSTFTGITLITTFTTTNGIVYLNAQVSAVRETDAYPATGDMIRQIELEILTKEFNIEKQAIIDVRNDSVDDAAKTVTT